MKYLVLISILIINQFQIYSQEFKNIILERTELRTIHSDVAGKDYELQVSLPMGYNSDDTTCYPVIILTDAYRSFNMVKGMVDTYTNPGLIIPPVIIVGIGYGGSGRDAMLRWAAGRTNDLTPVNQESTNQFFQNTLAKLGEKDVTVTTGGAPVFMSFIKTELLPFLESNYRIDNNSKLLCGYSFGGLFALYVLFHEPALFDKYLIGSPGSHYADGITLIYEEAFYKSNKELNARVFIAVGENEPQNYPDFLKLTGIIEDRNYKNLKLIKQVFKGEDHYSAAPPTYSKGLLTLLKN